MLYPYGAVDTYDKLVKVRLRTVPVRGLECHLFCLNKEYRCDTKA